jgi:hypothetical protein
MNATDLEDDIDRLRAEMRMLEAKIVAERTEGTVKPMTRVYVRLRAVANELRAMGAMEPCGCERCNPVGLDVGVGIEFGIFGEGDSGYDFGEE